MKWRKVLAPVLGAALLVPGMGTAAFADELPPTETTGAELRATLDSLLSEHYALAVDSMMKIYDGDDAAEAAMAAPVSFMSLYLPVPTSKRDENVRLPTVKVS